MDAPNPEKVGRRWRIGALPLPEVFVTLDAEQCILELTFLQSVEGEFCIGKRTHGAGTTFFATTRSGQRPRCAESGRVIQERTFRKLEQKRDESRRTIVKTRWSFTYEGTRFVLDVFSDPPGSVILEAESTDPAQAVKLPLGILDILEEVTNDPRYIDEHLALRAA